MLARANKITWRRLLGYFFLLLSILYATVTYMSLLDAHSKWVTDASKGLEVPCEVIKDKKLQLISMLKLTIDSMEKYEVPVFLLYGSIWGVLRGYKGPLPWDYDVDLGVEYDEKINLKLSLVIKHLEKENITTKRFLNRAGKLEFVDTNNNVIDLFLYRSTWFDMSWRLGWEPYLVFAHYFYYHSFPYRLVKNSKDLQKVKFGESMIRIPRGGKEIMKYLYRDNWEEEKKPVDFNCT